MSVISIKILGDEGGIGVDAFITALDNLRLMLGDLEKSASMKGDPALEWVVTDLRMGSLQAELTPRIKFDPTARRQPGAQAIARADDIAIKTISREIDSFNIIESESVSPPFLSNRAMVFAKRISEVVGTHGAIGIQIKNGVKNAVVTRASAETITKLVKESRKAQGSVEGVLERISLHKRASFTVYSTLTKKAVDCSFVRDFHLSDVKEALGRRVSVNGFVWSNMIGEPIRVQVETLRILRSSSELPSILSLESSDPDFTHGTPAEDYVGDLRSV